MTEKNSMLEKFKRMLLEGADLESVMMTMRKQGLSKIDSIKILVDLGQAPLAEAKKLVHTSETWDDLRDRDDKFHDDLVEKLKE